MQHAWIDGGPAPFDAAIERAAQLLQASRLPLFAGLDTDVAGVRAAIALAERTGGVVDHMDSDAMLRDIAVMREAGMMVTVPSEACLRADCVLVVGDALAADPAVRERLLGSGAARQVYWLCPGRGAGQKDAAAVKRVGRDPRELPALLAALRARLAGRPIGPAPLPLKQLDALAAELRGARFGVAVWAAAQLDAVVIEMLCGLVADLNASTRFTGLPLADPAARAVIEVCGWMTGFPVRTGFNRGYPEHDPWTYDAVRLVESGESDCAVWIASTRDAAPPWQRNVPTIALVGDEEAVPQAAVRIAVGRPGRDHDAVTGYDNAGTLVAVPASAPSARPPVATVLAAIAAATNGGAWPC
jgi:formylmethanofuran dehydrogenase subunit B